MRRTALLALLAAIVAGAAYGQSEPYSGPPGGRDPNDAYWPQPDASYDRQPDPIYDRDGAWTLASDEPFGWATYHYGRWAWNFQAGWLWVPGTGLPLATPLPYRFETQSTAVRPPMVAPVRLMSARPF
jgi:hypothetical protein